MNTVGLWIILSVIAMMAALLIYLWWREYRKEKTLSDTARELAERHVTEAERRAKEIIAAEIDAARRRVTDAQDAAANKEGAKGDLGSWLDRHTRR